jgi:hypothetical protein
MCCWTAVFRNRTGYMELFSVCVLTDGVLGQGRMGERSEMCCWSAVCWNRTGYVELCCVCVLTECVL